METKNIYQRILAVMTDLTYIQKESKKVNNQYTFVSHDAVSKAIHPKLVEHGISMVPTVKGWAQGGNRTSATVLVKFINADQPNDFVEVEYFGFGIDGQDKGPGKAISYATKYAMLKVFVLETGDDPERDMIEHVDEMKQAIKDCKQRLSAECAAIMKAFTVPTDHEDFARGAETWFMLPVEDKDLLAVAKTKGGLFDQKQRAVMRTNEWRSHKPANAPVMES